jgi:hypothetical protein
MTLQLDIGENAQDYSEIAKQEHLSGQQSSAAIDATHPTVDTSHDARHARVLTPRVLSRLCGLSVVQPSRLRCAS